jgi:hypothetical protein
MTTEPEGRQACGDIVGDVLHDIAGDNLLELAPGERLWKLFCIRPVAGRATGLQHRIYTKAKPNGHLGLVTFAVHSPVPGKQFRSGIARVADLLPEALDRIIRAILEQTHTRPEEYTEIDLSEMRSLDEQMVYLSDRAPEDRVS